MLNAASLVPSLTWLPRYDRRWLRARTSSAGWPPAPSSSPRRWPTPRSPTSRSRSGCTRAWCRWSCTPLLGGSRTLSVSTTSTVAILTGSTLLAAGVAAARHRSGRRPGHAHAARRADPARRPACCGSAALIDNISEATLTGIKVGVGLTVAAGQLPKLLGIAGDPTATTSSPRCGGIVDDLGDISWTTVAFSGADARRAARPAAAFAPSVPGAARRRGRRHRASSRVASIDEHGVALIAPVPSGLPTPVAPSFDHVGALLPGRLRHRHHVLPRDGVGRQARAPQPTSRRSTTTRSSPPTACRASPARSSGRCRRPAGSRRRRSTSAPARGPSSARW